jgi:hypothetical protein
MAAARSTSKTPPPFFSPWVFSLFIFISFRGVSQQEWGAKAQKQIRIYTTYTIEIYRGAAGKTGE